MRKGTFILVLISIFLPGRSQNTLFKRYEQNPLIGIGTDKPVWRTVHVANATVLTAGETADGTWRIYLRGNGVAPNYGGQIGILYQDSAQFSPYGPWLEYEDNPVLRYGLPGDYDDRGLLDPAPVAGRDGDVYLYYKARSYEKGASLAGAKSVNGGYTFEKFSNNPLKPHSGGSDALYLDDTYYIFYTNVQDIGKTAVYVKISPDPVHIEQVDSIMILTTGGGPDDFDSESVAAARIFRLNNRWYLVYPGSDLNFDFPNRFHAAWSDDLINWTKVDNDFPLFKRGGWGEWDQGGIWYGEVFQYGDTLYMLYEGWGCYCMPEDRDQPYFPGNSRTGIARAAVDDFLLWAGGGYDSSWVAGEIGPDGTIADFEKYTPGFHTTNDMSFEVVDNPAPDGVNPGLRVGKITTTSAMWESLQTEPFVTRFDFSGGSRFRMKVYSETGGNLYFRLEHPSRSDFGQIQIKKTVTTTHQWVDLEFDFGVYDPRPDLYGKIVLFFDGGGTAAGNDWYFDDIIFSSFISGTGSGPESTENEEKSIRVLYDRADPKIFLEGAGPNPFYRIYSIDGVPLREGKGPAIDISSLEQGIYIIRTGRSSAKFIRR